MPAPGAHRPVVLLTDPIDPRETDRLRETTEVRLLGEGAPDALSAAMRQADFVVVRRTIPLEALATAPRLRALLRHGAGLDFIPVGEASRLGIAVTNTPATNAQSVAEHAIGLALAVLRGIAANDAGIRAGEWGALRAAAPGSTELSGRTLGLIGYGGIGRAVARIAARGFGMDVVAARRGSAPQESGVDFLTLDEVAARADVLVVACPLTDETRNLVSAAVLARMKREAILVNIARGAVVDEAALCTALEDGRIAGAALDVFAEQPLPSTSALRRAPNVVLSPHIAGVTAQAMARMSAMVADDILAMLDGGRPTRLVNADAWPAITARWAAIADQTG